MQTRAQKIFESLKKDIQCSNNPLPFLSSSEISAKEVPDYPQAYFNHLKSLNPVVQFTKDLVNILWSPEFQNQWMTGELQEEVNPEVSELLVLFKIFLSALLTDVYKVADCSGFANLGFMHFLKSGIQNHVEFVRIDGMTKVRPARGSHVFLALDGDLQSEVESWRNFIKFDPWGEEKPVCYEGNQAPTRTSLGAGAYHSITNIQVLFRWERNLKPIDCFLLAHFFNNIADLLTVDLLRETAHKHWRTSCDPEAELARIHQRIDQEIEQLKSLIQLPPKPPRLSSPGIKNNYDYYFHLLYYPPPHSEEKQASAQPKNLSTK